MSVVEIAEELLMIIASCSRLSLDLPFRLLQPTEHD